MTDIQDKIRTLKFAEFLNDEIFHRGARGIADKSKHMLFLADSLDSLTKEFIIELAAEIQKEDNRA